MTTPSSPSVAYCFFGQYRTADYCLPWIQKTVQATPNVKAILVSCKARNTYPNSAEGKTEEMLDFTKVRESVLAHLPEAHVHVDKTSHELLNPGHGHWNYSRLFWSLNHAYSMYCLWEVSNSPVDLLVFHRLDTLVGPRPNSLPDYISKQSQVSPFDIWTDAGSFRFNYHEIGVGVSDLTLMGSPFALGTVLSYCTEALVVHKRRGWGRYNVGPNIHLKDAIDAASLTIRKMPGETAIVRPSANLRVPATDSFHYHAQYWRGQHSGNNKGLA